ncbi:unnamed protein product [Zymoseptoria tritici ST99CH_3D7]|uniref:Uncharacterized protein n=1 Tax=Zymoseptoria tritici (strain ST99CH_3D7) TaxID=1276538 RepID=A0A1X7RJ25_ZYMT9|nr:unnamed protein product [Zymoseptoria tritici ST99CH_3D7]
MAPTDKVTLFSLSKDIRLSIFEHLLVPGSFELGSPDECGRPRWTHIIRPEYAETPSDERHLCHSRIARGWHDEKARLIRLFGYNAKYLQYQLRSGRSRMPGIGPHDPRLHDLNVPMLSERGLRIVRRYATCAYGACDWRSSTTLTRNARAKFFAPLLICKTLYLELRTLVFSDNVFSFRAPKDLLRFISRLSSWQRDELRRVQILHSNIVILFKSISNAREDMERRERLMGRTSLQRYSTAQTWI